MTKCAEKSPYLLNPDSVLVENLIAGLTLNKMRYGRAYCPCRVVKGVPEEDRENICPCRSHEEDIALRGTCECGLFVSEAYCNAKKE